MLNKSDFRKSIRRAPLSDEGAAFMRSSLYALPEWQAAQSVFIYVSVYPEPDTRQIIADALALGKRVAVPKVLGRGEMLALEIESLSGLTAGALGIPEPPLSFKTMDAPDLAVIPCLACDREGYRIGHGGGYYDRYLARHDCFSVCLCPLAQIYDRVPTDCSDVKPDVILTERFIIKPFK